VREPYLRLSNYRRNRLRLGFTDADLDSASDYVIDALVLHGAAATGAAGLNAALAAGAAHVRYAGSVERLDLGEADDEKSVVLCDVGPDGLVARPALLPLESTPIYRVDITDPDAQLPALADRYPDAGRALVHYTLAYDPGTHDRETLCAAIQDAFPRWCSRRVREVGRVGVRPGRRPRSSCATSWARCAATCPAPRRTSSGTQSRSTAPPSFPNPAPWL
jgi:hypothetical protein